VDSDNHRSLTSYHDEQLKNIQLLNIYILNTTLPNNKFYIHSKNFENSSNVRFVFLCICSS